MKGVQREDTVWGPGMQNADKDSVRAHEAQRCEVMRGVLTRAQEFRLCPQSHRDAMFYKLRLSVGVVWVSRMSLKEDKLSRVQDGSRSPVGEGLDLTRSRKVGRLS